MSKFEIEGVLCFGDHYDYDGDQPWWTLRFASSLSDEDKAAVVARIDDSPAAIEGNFDDVVWESDRQCQVATMDPWFENQGAWNAFYRSIDTLFAALHEDNPLFAVFLQRGQFHDGEQELVTLSDRELSDLR